MYESADERNNWSAKEAQKQLLKVKKQKTQEEEAYISHETSADGRYGNVSNATKQK